MAKETKDNRFSFAGNYFGNTMIEGLWVGCWAVVRPENISARAGYKAI